MYTEFFGLTERPFQLTPDARYWFDSRSHKKAMAYLGYGIAQGEGFIVVTGEIGAGKSTLIAHLRATIDRARLNALTIVSTQVGADDMLRLVAQGLGLPVAGLAKAELLDGIEQRLNDEARSGKRTLLIVDEVQNLSVPALEELRMLSNFQSGGRALIQILLTGQPEFRDRLHGPGLEQLRQRVIASHHLQPMEEAEIEPYMLHRLSCARWKGRPAFAPDAFAAVHHHTDGVPRRINQLVDRLLLHAAIDRMEMIEAAAVEAVAVDMIADQVTPSPVKQEQPLPLRAINDVQPAGEPILPMRSTPHFTLVPQSEKSSATEPELERRLAELEQRLTEQDAALRRVLALLVDWVESDASPSAYRHNAA